MYRLGAAVPLALGALALVLAYRLSLRDFTDPGPGLWPFITALVVVMSAVAVLVTERDGRDYESFSRAARDIGLGLVSLLVFIALFEQIGFLIPSFLLLVFWLRVLGRESWTLTLAIAVASTAAFYVVFATLLGVPFPPDILVTILG